MSEESRMKKTIIRIAVCVVVFLASALIIGSIMNQGHNNMTMEMAPATLPMITMESGGVACNELHGNTVEMDVAYQKDCITLLGEGRQANFTVDTFGREITGISTEVRSIDGSRLIENSEVTGWKANGKSFSVSLTLKDLIDTNTQYSLTLILELEGEQKVYYYTTILWNDDVHISEILEFATDFHGKLYDKEVAKELTKYLEPNSKLTDNGTFHKVNIHSSFQQITWGSLEFEYQDSKWNPETCKYTESGWTTTQENDASITVTNNGNVDVDVEYRFTAAEDLTEVKNLQGIFVDEEDQPMDTLSVPADNVPRKTELRLESDKPTKSFDKTIGPINIVIKE